MATSAFYKAKGTRITEGPSNSPRAARLPLANRRLPLYLHVHCTYVHLSIIHLQLKEVHCPPTSCKRCTGVSVNWHFCNLIIISWSESFCNKTLVASACTVQLQVPRGQGNTGVYFYLIKLVSPEAGSTVLTSQCWQTIGMGAWLTSKESWLH